MPLEGISTVATEKYSNKLVNRKTIPDGRGEVIKDLYPNYEKYNLNKEGISVRSK